MAHGTPDWGHGKAETVYSLVADLAELAARLRSPVTHNREGNVIALETFEGGLGAWTGTGYGTGSDVALSALYPRTGSYSCLLTGGEDGDAAAKIVRRFPAPTLGNYGLEFSFLLGGGEDRVQWILTYNDGSQDTHFSCRIRLAEEQVQVQDENEDWQTVVSDFYLGYSLPGYAVVKTVADFVNGTFLRVITNSIETDISSYSGWTEVSDTGPSVTVTLWVYSESGEKSYLFVDDIILTQNETTR